jgi:hypothetical protein
VSKTLVETELTVDLLRKIQEVACCEDVFVEHSTMILEDFFNDIGKPIKIKSINEGYSKLRMEIYSNNNLMSEDKIRLVKTLGNAEEWYHKNV